MELMALPDWLVPMAATLTADRFAGPEWTFERKLDGIRVLAYKRGPTRAAVVAQSPAAHRRLPGRGPRPRRPAGATTPSSTAKRPARGAGRASADYHVFDVLWFDGRSVTAEPLEARRALLAAVPFAPPVARVTPLRGAKPWERPAARVGRA